jgi:hypothetical protein
MSFKSLYMQNWRGGRNSCANPIDWSRRRYSSQFDPFRKSMAWLRTCNRIDLDLPNQNICQFNRTDDRCGDKFGADGMACRAGHDIPRRLRSRCDT